MDIYEFFNSPDVVEYCQSVGHTFNAVESAVMVSQSISHTLAEKHAAYRTIITEYPDMEVPKGDRHPYCKSFHKALEKYIAIEKRLLEDLMKSEAGTIYRIYFKYDSGDTYDSDRLFTTYKKALNHAMNEIKSSSDSSSIDSITIQKFYPDKDTDHHRVCVSRTGKILSVNWPWPNTIHIAPKKYSNLRDLLDLYIDVPVPFKIGDLVEVVNNTYWLRRDAIYVLDGMYYTTSNNNPNWLYRASLFDMIAWGHYIQNGEIEHNSVHFYPNLQYCRRDLEGEMRILKYLSMYEKGEIDLDYLLIMQEYIYIDSEADRVKNHNPYDYKFLFHEHLGESLPWDEGGETAIDKYLKLYQDDKICICYLMAINHYLSLDEKRHSINSLLNLRSGKGV